MSFDPRVLVLSSVCVMPCAIAAEFRVETPAVSGLAPDDFSTQNNEVIIAILLRGQTTLNDAMQAYLVNDDIALPLEQTMLLLEFPIQVTADGAQGWFISENRTFLLDRADGKVQSDGKCRDPSDHRLSF